MSDWPRYVCHKVVQAAPIYEILDAGGALRILVKPYGDHRVESFAPTNIDMMRHAEVGGYAIIYDDGYRSISPQAAFDQGYTPI